MIGIATRTTSTLEIFRTAREDAVDALQELRDDAIVWLAKEILRIVTVCVLTGTGTENNGDLVFQISVPCHYRSADDFSPACLLTRKDIDEARTAAAETLIEVFPDYGRYEVAGGTHSYGQRLDFTVKFFQIPF